MESKIETIVVYVCYVGILENNMETTVVYWVLNIGIVEYEMETMIIRQHPADDGMAVKFLWKAWVSKLLCRLWISTAHWAGFVPLTPDLSSPKP